VTAWPPCSGARGNPPTASPEAASAPPSDTEAGNGGLARPKRFKSLKYVYLDGAAVTDAGVKRLELALPEPESPSAVSNCREPPAALEKCFG
jgi:hypothetical protein